MTVRTPIASAFCALTVALVFGFASIPSEARECCRVCKASQPCGNTCISKKRKCHTPPGCACTPEQAEEAALPLGFLLATSSSPADSRQDVDVIDGDTFDLNGERIRLEGIDAPELDQICHRDDGTPYACGVRAAAALKRILKGGIVSCRKDGEDRYGRTLAHCTAGSADVNRTMVQRGWAFAFLKYSTEFVEVEAKARASRLGIWKGTADPPWVWRANRTQ